MVLVMMVSSCHTTSKVANANPEPISTLMTRSNLKEILGPAYYVDSMVCRIRCKNTSEVSWKKESEEHIFQGEKTSHNITFTTYVR